MENNGHKTPTKLEVDRAEGEGMPPKMPVSGGPDFRTHLRARIDAIYKHTVELVRQKPLTALGVAAGSGFMLGLFGRRFGLRHIITVAGIGAAIKSAVEKMP